MTEMQPTARRPKQPLRVLHVIPSMAVCHGGPTKALAMMERVLAPSVRSTTLTTDDDGPGRRMPFSAQTGGEDGVPRVYVRKWIDAYKPAPSAVSWLAHNLHEFDVVHIHALFSFMSTCAGLMSRRRGIPYIVRPLGTLGAYGLARRRPVLKKMSVALLEGPIVRDAAAVHFTSESEREQAKALGIALRGVVIPLGVELGSTGNPGPATRTSSSVVQRILYLSRVVPMKNPGLLIEAFARISDTHRNARLVIAGDGDPAFIAELRGLAARLDVADRIDWLGHVAGDAKDRAIATADIYVLPSLSENFGIAAAEAMLAGLPCILTPGVAIAPDAAAAGAALMVEATVGTVADGLSALLGDDDRRRALGQAASQYAEGAFSATAMARRLVALYEDVVAAAPRRSA